MVDDEKLKLKKQMEFLQQQMEALDKPQQTAYQSFAPIQHDGGLKKLLVIDLIISGFTLVVFIAMWITLLVKK